MVGKDYPGEVDSIKHCQRIWSIQARLWRAGFETRPEIQGALQDVPDDLSNLSSTSRQETSVLKKNFKKKEKMS